MIRPHYTYIYIYIGSYLIADVLADEALLVDLDAFVPIVVLPAEERETRNEQRDEPHDGDHRRDPADRPLLDVVDARHRPVPIKILSAIREQKKLTI